MPLPQDAMVLAFESEARCCGGSKGEDLSALDPDQEEGEEEDCADDDVAEDNNDDWS